MNITLSGVIEPDEDKWATSCPELGIHTFGDTPEDAVESLKEAVSLYLEVAEKNGEMEELLSVLKARSPLQLSANKSVGEPPWLVSQVG